MIYLTGDTHIPIDIKKLNAEHFPEGKNLTKDDYVIILGDFGLIWNFSKTGISVESNSIDNCWTKEEIYWKEWLESKPWTTLFVDGNHENYDRLKTYPITEWQGGKVQKISDSIIHLMRGEIYDIDGKSFFVFGGASSHDRGPATGTQFIDEGVIWWKEELCSLEERDNAIRNLAMHENKVDYILTHCLPDNQMMKLGFSDFNITTNFLWNVEEQVEFKNWYCGHYHKDEWISSRMKILYYDVLKID